MFTVLSPALDWLGSGRTKCVKGTLCLTLTIYIYIYLSLSSPSLFPFDVLSHSISFTPFSPFPRSISLSRSSFLMFFPFPIRKSFIFVSSRSSHVEQSPPEIFAAAARSFSFVLIWTLEFLFLFFFFTRLFCFSLLL